MGQQQRQTGTPCVCQPLAPAFQSQAMVVSHKGAKTLGSKSRKPVIDARALATAGACQEKLSSLERDHISLNRVESE